MSSGGFSFPPPPPPPPPTSTNAFTSSNYGQHRGGRGAGNPHRGRGRGGPHRGGGGGRGEYMRDRGGHRGGYGASGGYQLPGPTTANPARFSHGPQHQWQQNMMYSHSLPGNNAQTVGTPSGPKVHPPQHAQPTFGWAYPGVTAQHQGQGGFKPHGQNKDNTPTSNAPGGKRPHATSRPTAPLPVPSFGNPLPSKPPPAVDTAPKRQTKKRKYNQLGLTPKTEEHESSEEDDADEEMKLGAKFQAGELRISYRGQTSTLRTQADIARWIEERRKRFPTQARVEERRKDAEAKKAEKEALRHQKQAAAEEARQRSKEARSKKGERGQTPRDETPTDPAAKAKLRAEKLRSKLMKQEKKLAKAEAEAEKARLLAEAPSSQPATKCFDDADGQHGPKEIVMSENSATHPMESEKPPNSHDTLHTADSLQITSIPGQQNLPAAASETTEVQSTGSLVQGGQPSSDLEPTTGVVTADNSDDETSSSGSDSSSDLSSSEDSDSDATPEEISSRRQGPERVPPPPRGAARDPKSVCRQFAKTGRCQRGERCKYAHEKRQPAEKGSATNRKRLDGQQNGRKSLFQTLLDRQRVEEDRRVMQAISWLGEKGILDSSEAL